METLQILYTFADHKYTIPTWIVILNSFDLDFLSQGQRLKYSVSYIIVKP